MKRILNGDTMFGAVILIICIGFFTMGFQYTGMAGDAGPGLFPQIIAVITGIFALSLTISGIRKGINGEEVKTEAFDRKNFYYTLLFMTMYLASWKYIHFIICTEIFLLAMCWNLKFSAKFSIIYSTIFSVGIYYIFANIFRILL